MAQASEVFKQIAIKQETTYGTLPAAASAQLLRRTGCQFNLTKDSYESNETRTDFQVSDYRHGVRRVAGTLNGELSAGSYSPYIAALLKRDFAAIADLTALSITIAAGAGSTYTLTRAAGSYLTAGVKVGQVVRLTAGAFNASNLNKNLLVTAVTATVVTVLVVNGSALVAEGPIASATMSVPGKWTYTPTTGHTDKSWSLEEWFSDISQSEVYSGLKFNQAAIKLPPTGMATIDLSANGKDIAQSSGVRYFTSPTAIGSTGVLAAVNGLLRVNDTTMLTVTSLDMTISADFNGDPVVGANTVPNQFAGTLKVEGNFSVYFEDGTLRDLFVNETETSLYLALTANNSANADFITIVLPRVKVGSSDKNNSGNAVVRNFSFKALFNSAGGTGTSTEQTTLCMQDSQAA